MSTHIALRPASLHDDEALWDLEEAIEAQFTRRAPRGSAVVPEALCPQFHGKAQETEGNMETQMGTETVPTPITVIHHHKGIPTVVDVHVTKTLDTPFRHFPPGIQSEEEIIIVRHEHPSTRARHFTAVVRVYNAPPSAKERAIREERTAGGLTVTRRTDILALSETVLNDLRATLAQ